RGQHLQRHQAVDLLLTRKVNNPHAPARNFLDQLVLAKGSWQGQLGGRRLWRAIEWTVIQHGCEKAFRAQSPGRVLWQCAAALGTDGGGWQILHHGLVSILVWEKTRLDLCGCSSSGFLLLTLILFLFLIRVFKRIPD